MTDHRHQRESSLNQHPLVPSASSTEFEVIGKACHILEANVCQDDSFVFIGSHQGQKDLISDIGSVPCPVDDLSRVIEQPTQLHAHDPVPIAFPLRADLLLATSFADRVKQFNPITVNGSEKGRFGQKDAAPVLVGQQQSLQAGALRQASKQTVIIPPQPADKRAEVTAFECEQQPNGDDLARIQLGLRMFGNDAHLVIYPAEPFDDKVFTGHGSYLQQLGDYWLYEFRDLFSTSTSGY